MPVDKILLSIYTSFFFPPVALSAVLGIPLGELVIRDGLSVPYIVTKIVQRVEEEGLDQVGIYRINGNVKVIEKLRTSFDRGNYMTVSL